MASQKEKDKFVKGIQQVLKEQHAERCDANASYRFRLVTAFGYLYADVRTSDVRGFLGMVFTRFEEPEKAKAAFECNPFSGKWNHCYLRNWTASEAIEDFRYQLQQLRQREVFVASEK